MRVRLVESLGHSRLVTLAHRDCEMTAWLRGGCQLLTEPDIMAAEKTVMVQLQLEKGRLFDRVSGAALVGCAVSTGIGAVWNTAGVRPGERVAVIGCGGVGLSAVLGALAIGASPVIAVDLSEQKLELARSVGATDTVRWAGSADATARAIKDASAGGVDYAIEATGRPEAMQAAFLACRPRGAAVLIGIARGDAMLTLPAIEIPRSERRILGSAYGSARPERDFPRILQLYAEGRLPLDRLISHRMPLAETAAAIDLVRMGTAVRAVLQLA